MILYLGNDENKTTDQIIGSRIRAHLEKNESMSKTEFYEKVYQATGKVERTTRGYLNGETSMSASTFKEIAKILDLPYEYLLGDSWISKKATYSTAMTLRKYGIKIQSLFDKEFPSEVKGANVYDEFGNDLTNQLTNEFIVSYKNREIQINLEDLSNMMKDSFLSQLLLMLDKNEI